MESLPVGYHALVIGASGAIGAAFLTALEDDTRCSLAVAVSRSSHPGFDLCNEAGLAELAAELRPDGPFHLIVDATGALMLNGMGPEKHLGALNAAQLRQAFDVNTIGPALLLRYLTPLLAGGERCIYAKLSARVGSISDNHKGGWYGYRASKAALNMLLQTAAIELHRKRPLAVVAALQPGTVASPLSAPFAQAAATIAPEASVRGMLAALDGLEPAGRAQFVDYRGQPIPW